MNTGSDRYIVTEVSYDRLPWKSVTIVLQSIDEVDVAVARALCGEDVLVEGDAYGVTITRRGVPR